MSSIYERFQRLGQFGHGECTIKDKFRALEVKRYEFEVLEVNHMQFSISARSVSSNIPDRYCRCVSTRSRALHTRRLKSFINQ